MKPLKSRIAWLAACLLCPTLALAQIERSGDAPAGFDASIEQFMLNRVIPAATVAVVRDNRLVALRAYRHRALQTVEVQPDSRFRIASLSKPITALAIMQLVQAGHFTLDTPVSEILDMTLPQSGRPINVRDLLQHSAGWDRALTGDPAFMTLEIARALGVAAPASARELVDHAPSIPLSFATGSEHRYSNYGYIMLGRIVEKVSGMEYADYVRRHIFEPAGIHGAYVGSSLRGFPQLGEQPYVARGAGLGGAPSVFDAHPGQVPTVYGSFAVESFDSAGGWVMSASELARFLLRFDGDPETPDLLEPSFDAQVTQRPSFVSPNAPNYYGLGWAIAPGGVRNHAGGLVGTATVMAIDPNTRTGYVMLTNAGLLSTAEYGEMAQAAQAAVATTAGSTADLFDQYAPEVVDSCRAASAWYDPTKSGQGYSLRDFGDGTEMAAFWFSYASGAPLPSDNDNGHLWLVGLGHYAANAAGMQLYYSSGGAFDSTQPVDTTAHSIGRLELLYADPDNAVARFVFNESKHFGSQPLVPLVRPPCG